MAVHIPQYHGLAATFAGPGAAADDALRPLQPRDTPAVARAQRFWDHWPMTHFATRNLPALALLAALAGCASRAPFELPDLDARSPAGMQAAPQAPYPAYRYGYRPYGWYGHSQRDNTNQPRDNVATPGTPGAAPAPGVVEQPPPRPRSVEREPQERPARTTKAADDAQPARRQQEQ
jgi:predicted small lipoprotein YifL